MGLFGVNMPPLYGEGAKAFQRLQLEILRVSDDESLFAWQCDPPADIRNPDLQYAPGLLAESPAAFAMSGDIIRSYFDKERPPFSMTNKGLRMEFLIAPKCNKDIKVPLNCVQRGERVSLTVRKSVWGSMPGFHRTWDLCSVNNTKKYSKRTVLFIKQRGLSWFTPYMMGRRPLHFVIRSDSLLRSGFTVFEELNSDNLRPSEDVTNHIQTRPIQEHGERECRFTIERLFHKVFLNFWNWDSDGFVLVLWVDNPTGMYEDALAVSIFVPEQQTLAQLYPILNENINKIVHQDPDVISRADRISRCMKSGKSVSVALRRGVDSGNLSYILDIKIDPTGKLLWPDLDSEIAIK